MIHIAISRGPCAFRHLSRKVINCPGADHLSHSLNCAVENEWFIAVRPYWKKVRWMKKAQTQTHCPSPGIACCATLTHAPHSPSASVHITISLKWICCSHAWLSRIWPPAKPEKRRKVSSHSCFYYQLHEMHAPQWYIVVPVSRCEKT